MKSGTAVAAALTCAALLGLPAVPALSEPPGNASTPAPETPAPEDTLSPEETLGRQIFFAGEGEDGREITAILGEGGAEVPASVLPCASCHGEDGLGRPEGGLDPSNITWRALTKPYGAKHPGGRVHPPYTAYLVKRAITMGLDAGGNALHVAMPRYQLTHTEAAALTAFLQRLGHQLDPGIDETSVKIGVVLPPAGGSGELGQAIQAVLEAAATRVNDAGGIYSRHLDLSFLEPPAATRSQSIESFLAKQGVFALVASFMAGADAEIAAVVDRAQVPSVGPISVYPQTGFPINRYIFYLTSGFPEQARVLVKFAARKLRLQARRSIVVYPQQEAFDSVVAAIQDQGTLMGETPWNSIEAIAYPPGRLDPGALARRELRAGTDTVFFVGPASAATALIGAANEIDWTPHCFLLGPLTDSSIFAAPTSFADRIFFSFATLPTDTSPQAYANYRELASQHQLPANHVASQLAALAAFGLLMDALERTGRDLSREKLIASLEGLYQYPSTFTPALTYGPNRRIGALGAYVVAPDLENKRFMLTGDWIPLR